VSGAHREHHLHSSFELFELFELFHLILFTGLNIVFWNASFMASLIVIFNCCGFQRAYVLCILTQQT